MAAAACAELQNTRLVVMRLLDRKLSMGWRAWRDVYLSMIQEETNMRLALTKMLERELLRSWITWRSIAAGSRDLALRLKHANALLEQTRLCVILNNWRMRLRDAQAWEW